MATTEELIEQAAPRGGQLVQMDKAAPMSVETLIVKAIEHDFPVEGLERLLAMRERVLAEQARSAFYEALAAFQAGLPVIQKRKTARIETNNGGSYTYRYAPLEDIVSEVGPMLRSHGLSYSFDTRFEAGEQPAQVVICTVHHVQGHQASSEFRTPIDGRARMSEAQKSASAQTYAKRYAFCNALGILTGDEDTDDHRRPPAPSGVDPDTGEVLGRAPAAESRGAAASPPPARGAAPAAGDSLLDRQVAVMARFAQSLPARLAMSEPRLRAMLRAPQWGPEGTFQELRTAHERHCDPFPCAHVAEAEAAFRALD